LIPLHALDGATIATIGGMMIYGMEVPAADYETLRQLERIAFGLTPSEWPDSKAHRIALEAAVEGLAAMRLCVRRTTRAKVKAV
jgi:hypothetical protein